MLTQKLKMFSSAILQFRNLLFQDSASDGGQAKKSVPHANENKYNEKNIIDEDKKFYAYDAINDIPLLFEVWHIDFDARFAKSRQNRIKDMKESKWDLKNTFVKGFKSMQKHIDGSIDHILESIQEKDENKNIRQVDFFDNLILQNQMSVRLVIIKYL